MRSVLTEIDREGRLSFSERLATCMTFCRLHHQLDLRYVFLRDSREQAYSLLSPQLHADERMRASRYRLAKDRVAFAAGRLLVRSMLSEYAQEPFGGWHFQPNPFGKPEIVQGSGAADLRFNISHSDGVVVAAVSHGRDIGVDVEHVRQKVDGLEIARSQFAAEEAESLEALPAHLRDEAFLSMWTLKEAYSKGCGLGASMDFSECAFGVGASGVQFESQSAETQGNWFFWQQQLSDSYLVAVAAERRPWEQLTCHPREIKFGDLLKSPKESVTMSGRFRNASVSIR